MSIFPGNVRLLRAARSDYSPTHPNPAFIARLGLVAAVLVGLSATAHAQQVPPQTLPNAGELLQQVPQQPLSVPASDLDLKMLKAAPATAPSSPAFLVKAIRVKGNTLLPESKLRALVASSEGRELTLANLDALAEQISAAYRKAGYPLTRAYVPAQTIQDGVVELDVIEARYGKVVLENHSSVSDRTLDATLAPLQSGAPVSNGPLERSLLLLSDIPGAQPSSAIRPGEAPGTSDLVVEVAPAPRYTGTLSLDDFGNPYTGRVRLGGSFDVNGPFHRGDLFDVSALSSGSRMSYAQGGYRALLDGQGTTLRVGASALYYHLGDGLEALDAHGSALIGSVALTQPFIRSTADNLYGQIEFDRRFLKDAIGVADINNDRQASVWIATLAGDERDARGITNFNISATHGRIAFTNQLASLIDFVTARTQGAYDRYTASVSRLQQIDPTNAIYAGYTVQWASKNLDSSEQLFLGGPNTVRGYDTGALAGSQGDLVTAEFRHDFSILGVAGRWQAVLFADSGRIEVYKDRFADMLNDARLSSAGIGLAWAGPDAWTFRASVAKPIGPIPALLNGASTPARFWLTVQEGFD